jgi:phosphoserine aminotransferase
MVSRGLVTEGLFVGETINTPSLLAVEDAIDGLRWARDIGGLSALKARCQANFDQAASWIGRNEWCDFLATNADIRSETSICLKIVDPAFADSRDQQAKVAAAVVSLLAEKGVAYDVGSYRTAPPGFRFWGGATVEASDLVLALDWLTWAYIEARKVVL